MTTPPKDPILEPFELGHLRLRNRIMSTAHAPSYQEGGHPRERYRLYHVEKAKGGVGLTMIGGSTNIAPDSPSVFGQLYAGDDSIIPWFEELTGAVKAEGAAVMCQITHMGRRTAWDDGHWLPVLGPSGVRERAHRAQPKAMEPEDIARITQQFADAALRCKAGGFDGVELLSHSHLLGQFLSPLINQRRDGFGGALEARLRLSLEVIARVREAVGPDFILGLRMTGDELAEGGIGAEECIGAAQLVAETGAIDFLNVLAGAPYDDLGLAGWVPPMGLPSAAHLGVAGAIRAAVNIPVFHAGGVADLATARHALSAGLVDMIGMTRAQMADPYLVQKLSEGREAEIRPCVGLGYCVDRVNQGKDALCGHNAATGREARMPHIISPSGARKKVVIIGGGVGGLEAARVCALRGHDVTLFEAAAQLGGQLRLAAKSATRRQIWGVADWLCAEVSRLGVELRLEYYAEAEDVLAEAPDLVIVATGGWPEMPALDGAELITLSWDVLSGAVRVSGEVLLFDEIGDQAGLAAAEFMARSGADVTLITPDTKLAHDLGPTTSSVGLRDLSAKGVRFALLEELASVRREGNHLRASLRHVLTGAAREALVDHVVMECGTQPLDALYFELKAGSKNAGQLDQSAMIEGRMPFVPHQGGAFWLARVGDAVAGRNIHAAIYDALRICHAF